MSQRDFCGIVEIFQSFLKRVTYKPGWELWLTASILKETITLYVNWTTKDVSCPSSTIQLTASFTVSMNQLESMKHMDKLDQLQSYIGWLVTDRIKWVELHEMDEWLKVDGKCLREPHPELARQRERELEKEACSKI